MAVAGLIGALLMSLLVIPTAPVARADAAGKGGDYVPLSKPHRAFTTAGGVKKGPRTTTNVKVTGVGAGADAVPATGVAAVLVDLYGQGATAATWFNAWPTGPAARPGGVDLWVPAGSPGISNTALVAVGTGGEISVYNEAGSVHMTVDIQGYFLEAQGSAGGRGGFVPTPHGVMVNATKIDPNKTLTVQVSGVGGVPATASSAFFGVRVASTVAGSISAYPAGGTAGNSTVDYGVGASTSGASVKLGTNGQVVFLNRGTAAINLYLTIEGYFSASPSTGAGFRKATGRLANGVTIASQASLDLAVGGQLGLPTRAIAGAAFNFSVLANTTGGYLKAWPLGSAEPTGIVSTYPADSVRASMAIVRVGTEGKIRIHNESNGPIQIWADLLGWFADPLPPVPICQFSRTSVLQLPPSGSATLGFVEYAYVDNIGRLVHGHQTDPGATHSVQWSTISDGDAYSGQPAMSYLQNGALQISAQNIDSNVRVRTQTALYPAATWGAWANLGGSPAEPPVYGRLADGRTVLFAIDADGRLWHRMQNEYWRPSGDLNLVGTVAIVNTRLGLQVFAFDSAGALRTAHYQNGVLSAWTSLGGSGLNGSPSVVVYPGYLMRVFARAADGSIVTKRQQVEGGAFDVAWSAVGTFTSVSSPAAVLSPVTGKTEVVATGTDNLIHSTGETGQGTGQWRNWQWTEISVQPATELTAFTYNPGGGPIWALVYRDQNNVNYVSTVRESGLAGQPAVFGHKAVGKA